jgi:hypothetical protein
VGEGGRAALLVALEVEAIDPGKNIPSCVALKVLVASVADTEADGMRRNLVLGFDQEEDVGEVGLGCARIVGGNRAQRAVHVRGGVVADVGVMDVHLQEQQPDLASGQA